MANRAARIVIYFLVLVFAMACFAIRARSISEQWGELHRRDDFNHYYATSWLIQQGTSPYGVVLEDLALLDAFEWQETISKPTNPPFLALLTAPLAKSLPRQSWDVWIGIVIGAAFLSMLLVMLALSEELSSPMAVLLIVCFLASSSFFTLITHAQIQSLILLCSILGWIFFRQGKLFAPAALWGFATAVKFYTWPLLLILLFKSRGAFAVACIFLALCLALPCLVFYPAIYLDFVAQGLPGIQSAALELGHNLSFGRSFYDFVVWIVPSLESAPITQAFCFTAFPLSLVVVCLGLLNHKDEKERSEKTLDYLVSFAIFMSFVCAPVAWPNYLLAMMVPMAVVVAYQSANLAVPVIIFAVWVIVFQNPHPEFRFSFISEYYFYPVSRAFVVTGALSIWALFISDRKSDSDADCSEAV